MGGHESLDQWARWVLCDRFGSNDNAKQASVNFLESIRDRVLDNAEIEDGDTVLDVGCGDGLIGFGALSRVGQHGQVILSDISQDLLDHCETAIRTLGVENRCTTINTSADSLEGIPSGSIDVVTARSVLIYVEDKRAAFESFWRVLRPGGRVSLFEPINKRSNEMNRGSFIGFNITGVEELVRKVRDLYERAAPKSMTGFDETDLFSIAQRARFFDVRVTLELTSQDLRGARPEWPAFKDSSPNPLAPTIAQAMEEVLTEAEVKRLDAHLSENLAAGEQGGNQSAVAFLRATKSS